MLAKDITLKNLKRQRDFILGQISQMKDENLGDAPSYYRFVGHVFPQVLEYLEKYHNIHGEFAGYNIGTSNPVTLGAPIYIFYPKTPITDKELEEIGFFDPYVEENDEDDFDEGNCFEGVYDPYDHEDNDGYAEELSQYM